MAEEGALGSTLARAYLCSAVFSFEGVLED